MDQQHLSLSYVRTQLIVWNLLLLVPIVGMAIDLVAPSLPAIAHGLHMPQSIVQNIISLYLIGYGIGNFVSGLLTDAFGRRRLLLGGICSFALFSLIAAIIPNILILLVVRLLQGIALGTMAVTIRAIVSDILPAKKLVAMGIMFGMMWGLGPVIGPVIGAYLESYYGWQSGFYFFAIMAGFGFIFTFILVPETHLQRQKLSIKFLMRNLSEIVKHRQFIMLAILMGLTYSLIITFNTAGPFLLQHKFHYTAVMFGNLALYLGLVYLSSTFLCRYLVHKYTAEQLLLFGINLLLLITLIALFMSYFFATSIILIVIMSGVMFFACGFLFPLAMGRCMSLFRHIAGTASATMYLIDTLITSLIAAFLSLINMQNAIELMCIYSLLGAAIAVVYWYLIRKP